MSSRGTLIAQVARDLADARRRRAARASARPVIGASDYGPDTPTGPLSPEQLSTLNRALSPSELEAVRAWQEERDEAQRVALRAAGAPQSRAISVTPQGAVIERPRTSTRPWWFWVAGAGSIAAILVGLILATKGKTK